MRRKTNPLYKGGSNCNWLYSFIWIIDWSKLRGRSFFSLSKSFLYLYRR
jgi:hypothetical protein